MTLLNFSISVRNDQAGRGVGAYFATMRRY